MVVVIKPFLKGCCYDQRQAEGEVRTDAPKEITANFAGSFLNNSCVSLFSPAKGFGWENPISCTACLAVRIFAWPETGTEGQLNVKPWKVRHTPSKWAIRKAALLSSLWEEWALCKATGLWQRHCGSLLCGSFQFKSSCLEDQTRCIGKYRMSVLGYERCLEKMLAFLPGSGGRSLPNTHHCPY